MPQLSQRSPLDVVRAQDLICMRVGDWPCIPFRPPYNPANFVSATGGVSSSSRRLADCRRVVLDKICELQAGVAQLAEHNVANVVVVGSNPITRSLGREAYFVFVGRPRVCGRKID